MTYSITEVCFSAKRGKKSDRDLGGLSEESLFDLILKGKQVFTTLTRKSGLFQAAATACINTL